MENREIVLSFDDAVVLDGLVRRPRRGSPPDEAVEELAVALEIARVISSDRLPTSVIALGAEVEYHERPDGPTRRVVLAHPANADASRGRISVLSPVGRALLGRRTGDVAGLDLPSGARREIEILRVERGGNDE